MLPFRVSAGHKSDDADALPVDLGIQNRSFYRVTLFLQRVPANDCLPAGLSQAGLSHPVVEGC